MYYLSTKLTVTDSDSEQINDIALQQHSSLLVIWKCV